MMKLNITEHERRFRSKHRLYAVTNNCADYLKLLGQAQPTNSFELLCMPVEDNRTAILTYLNPLDAMIGYRSMAGGKLGAPQDFCSIDLSWYLERNHNWLSVAVNYVYVAHQNRLAVNTTGQPIMLAVYEGFHIPVLEKSFTMEISDVNMQKIKSAFSKINCENFAATKAFMERPDWDYASLEETADEAIAQMPGTVPVQELDCKNIQQFAIYDPYPKSWLFADF